MNIIPAAVVAVKIGQAFTFAAISLTLRELVKMPEVSAFGEIFAGNQELQIEDLP